uniref:Nucleophosmin 1a n=1 Tax=Oncorhynchus kisutch TaxID=8019 RepID=A0A8C7LCE0_ONCKI
FDITGDVPQTTGLARCELKSGKDVVFNPEEDDFEHQLDLRMVCVDPSTKDELHVVEVEGQNAEGEKVKAVLAALKPSTLPSVCLSGFAITSPAVFRLKAGSGPIHISGQHLVSEYCLSRDYVTPMVSLVLPWPLTQIAVPMPSTRCQVFSNCFRLVF